MAKKHKVSEKAVNIQVPRQEKTYWPEKTGYPALIACLLYFVVHFIPDMGGYDAMGAQWFYVVIIDLAVTLFLLARKNAYTGEYRAIFQNTFSKLYLAYFILAGLSVFQAINPTEGWVCYVRLIATIVAYFNISILLNGRLDLVKIIAQVLGIILLIESVQAISQFVHDVDTIDMNAVILSLKGTTGNKNIFAASTIVKIPFVLYCIYTSKLWGKIINMVILALGTLTIFLVNARASYLSLIFITLMYVAYCIIAQVKEKKTDQTLYKLAYVLIPILAAYFVSQVEISNVKNLQDQKGGYGTVTERLGSVVAFNAEDNNVRFRLWSHAIDYTKKHPVMGCGYGNWKIASIPYQKYLTDDLIVPVHAHNDFFENFAELGILGGLLYLSLFCCIALFTWKTFRSNAEEKTKLIAVFSFMSFIGYSIDAFFNFPGERPISQVFFILICAININAYLAAKKQDEEQPSILPNTSTLKAAFGFVALLLLLPSLYVTYLTYKSLVIQKSVMKDIETEPLKMDWKEVFAAFPSIPNLCGTGQPVEGIKGRYLSELGKYDEAMKLMDKGREANPVIGYSEFLKAGAYFKMGKYDSASRNALTAYYMRPRAKNYYQTLMAVLSKTKDSANIQKAFEEYNKYRPSEFAWNYYLMAMLRAVDKGTPYLLKMADSSLKLFPGNPDLLSRKNEIILFMSSKVVTKADTDQTTESQKYFQEGITVYGTGNLEKAASLFLKAAALNPNNFLSYENAAMCYFNLKSWQKAIHYFDKELALNLSSNGKPEYYKAVALINSGKKDEGCAFLHIASSKGWKDADGIIKSHCGS
jgi:O-antigen ligase/tetratricopeptide (TPR) repeat protein